MERARHDLRMELARMRKHLVQARRHAHDCGEWLWMRELGRMLRDLDLELSKEAHEQASEQLRLHADD